MNNLYNRTLLVLVIITLVTNTAWAMGFYFQKRALNKAENELEMTLQNKKIIGFQKLFVDKVLRSSGEVDFDTRVMLQNTVNDTEDREIIEVWNGFLRSKTEAEGQQKVKELLSLLSNKIFM